MILMLTIQVSGRFTRTSDLDRVREGRLQQVYFRSCASRLTQCFTHLDVDALRAPSRFIRAVRAVVVVYHFCC